MSDLRKAAQQALKALITAEAGLADIGDADREPGDDVAWCEARAAQALAEPRQAITALCAALTIPEPEPEPLMQDGIEDRETRGLSKWLSTRVDDYRAWRPEPEPVAWFHAETYKTYFTTSPDTHLKGKYWFPLFASPTQRKPLTEQQIEDLGPLSFTWRDMVEFARAIERAHGIGGEV